MNNVWLTGLPAEQFIALVTLLVAGTFTPGPNTTIAAVTGANFGARATLPHSVGVSIGFASIVALCAAGVGALILASPWLATLIHVLGVIYLLWLALRIARSSALSEKQVLRPLTVWQSAALQYANIKAWMLSLAVAASYMAGAPSALHRALLVSAVFATLGFISNGFYGVLGASLRRWLAHGNRVAWFNRVMGLALGLTAVWIAVGARPGAH
ncbi:LysE family translocator [Cupriavidus plantarum]|uniref:Threonine/homoserine/homoserine lactone efflux protein n=1 Tax=Cupriavidus plantarum TaxID=942865 RepID=A0A316EZ14_9BURK|nr:LysE family translocator [Cupriavidus plantarum]NYH99477.1 threonine/homoserine/homoserine lactone efflux protein [Cupriavidus plantarum]PWK36688.1 threonine/homoserine/homoserine lactone efflux protein [Cupriavidus plantarum]REF02574.1 threonine/homoserine/homoserine lactone efflux protein [Cupriavidus plantarum]RLK44575.1 threonine/homoserine/homoserine lactone efflux protein [Cupriavidus plantarum]CAG2143784.1 Cysteine/O-acetylserine efflux protein [Cupriavidus plantarum]